MTDSISPEAMAAVLRKGAERRPLWVAVSGGSMGSAIPSGARVLVERRAQPRRGEVWAFCTLGRLIVVHRFRRRRRGDLWFQGDANKWADVPIAPDLLVGRVVAIEIDAVHRRLGLAATLRARAALDVAALRYRTNQAWQRRHCGNRRRH